MQNSVLFSHKEQSDFRKNSKYFFIPYPPQLTAMSFKKRAHTKFFLQLFLSFFLQRLTLHISLCLTEVAGEGGPDLAPQKILLPQQFRHLMRCKKYCLPCLVPEI